jgi:hypothetical protein
MAKVISLTPLSSEAAAWVDRIVLLARRSHAAKLVP